MINENSTTENNVPTGKIEENSLLASLLNPQPIIKKEKKKINKKQEKPEISSVPKSVPSSQEKHTDRQPSQQRTDEEKSTVKQKLMGQLKSFLNDKSMKEFNFSSNLSGIIKKNQKIYEKIYQTI